MSEYWYKCFITKEDKYVLIDDDGNIRANARDLEDII